MIRSVAKLAQGMGTRTIAELVGDQHTYATVAALGVDYAQALTSASPPP